MEPQKLVVLYSKFSSKCKELLDLYPSNPSFEFICIDNRNIRKKLTQSKRINIQSVPCVVFMFEDGTCEKMEGDEVVEWLHRKFGTHQKPPSVPLAPVPPVSSVSNDDELLSQSPPSQTQYVPITTLPQEADQQVSSTIKKINTKKEKSLAELAAEMAAEREDPEPPKPQLMAR